MSTYDEMLDFLERLPESAWTHPLYHKFSWATFGGETVTLYHNGWLGFNGHMLGAWPWKRRGARLFKQVRDTRKWPTDMGPLAAFRAAAEKMREEEES